nr:VITF-3 32 kDa small subunit [Wadden Sea poxvirus]
MFEQVPDLNLEASVEIGDINVDKTKAGARESTLYISKSKRLFTHKTKDEERKLALGFFLPRLYFLDHKEINYLFRCVDEIKSVHITKKNNIIVAPYIILLTMSSKGYKFTETMIELFFPELYNEHSKKFKFNSQICIIQEKLGYKVENYHVYDFEPYYSTIALSIRNNSSEYIFNTRQESSVISSLSEITYRLYLMHLKSDTVQWSTSTGTIINQMVNTVLITIYEILERSIKENIIIRCSLSNETELPISLLIERKELLEKIINGLRSTRSFKVNRKDKDILLKHCN